jgi:hypothetical protein
LHCRAHVTPQLRQSAIGMEPPLKLTSSANDDKAGVAQVNSRDTRRYLSQGRGACKLIRQALWQILSTRKKQLNIVMPATAKNSDATNVEQKLGLLLRSTRLHCL